MTLTQKQENFCLAYVELGNASEAYRRAYNATKMKSNTVEKRACELLKDGKVTGRIAELRAQVVQKVVLDRAWVIERLMRNVRIAMGEEKIKVAIRPKAAPDTVLELEITDRDAAAANAALALLGKCPEVALFSEQPARDGDRIPPQDAPRDTGQDHLEALSRRYAAGLRVIEGAAAAKLNGVSDGQLNAASAEWWRKERLSRRQD